MSIFVWKFTTIRVVFRFLWNYKNVKKLRVNILSGFCVDRLFKNIEKMTKIFQNHKNMNFFQKN